MTFSFYPDAEAEFLEAIDFYEEREDGLGLELSREIFATIQRIIQHPNAWPSYTRGTRRCLTKRFPFGIVYRVDDDKTIIWAVTHLSREPEYWLSRII